MHTFSYRWDWHLDSSPDVLWPYVSDTDRFDAAVGLPPITVRTEQVNGETVEIMAMRIFGVSIEWTQHPFEWIEPREFWVRREYRSGPLAWLEVRTQLEPASDGGTLLHYQVDAAPSGILGHVVIPVQIGLFSRKAAEQAFRAFDREAQTTEGSPTQRLPLPQRTPVRDAAQLRATADRLRGLNFAEPLVDRLIEYLETASDDRVARIRPFVLADSCNEDRIEVLRLCLYATRLGLLELQWDLICPSCRGAPHRLDSLRDVDDVVGCPACRIDYEVDFEHSVEVTFQVHPSIRSVQVDQYCHHSPRDTDHVMIQKTLPTGTTLEVPLEVRPGAYRVRIPSHSAWSDEVHSARTWRSSEPWQARLEALRDGADTITHEPALRFADGQLTPNTIQIPAQQPVTLSIINDSDDDHLLIVERAAWFERAATAARVTTLQTFRDFFATEALKLGLQIRAGTVTVLFTDLKESTRLYREVGDGPAFERVATHFDMLRECVEAENGALVKTIGDAVMAVFIEPARAVRAGLNILRAFDTYNRDDADWPLQIKVGLHKGPALAVTLNDQLDYFGTTINLASRLQRESNGDEVVLSDTLYRDPGVQTVLDDESLDIELDTAVLSGFERERSFWRICRPVYDYQPAVTA